MMRPMLLLRSITMSLVTIMILSACSGSQSDEELSLIETQLDSVADQRNRLRRQLDQVAADLDSSVGERVRLQQDLDQVSSDLDSSVGERVRLQQDLDQVSSDLDSSVGERARLQQDLDQVSSDLDSVEGDRDQILQTLGEVRTELESIEAKRNDLEAARWEQNERMADLETELNDARASSEEAQKQVQYLVSKYDEEIRADLQSAIDAEIERVCTVASDREHYEKPISSLVGWKSDWEPIANRTNLERLIEDCAEPKRQRVTEQISNEMQAAMDAEIERACADAIEHYDQAIGSLAQWDPQWELVATHLQLIQAVEECSKPERTRLITEEIQAAVDAEIERACAAAIESYRQEVGPMVRWNYSWVTVATRSQLIEAVEQCAVPERSRQVTGELQATVSAEIERACTLAIGQYEKPVMSFVRWESEWEAVTTQAKLERAVNRCAEAERTRLLEQRRAMRSIPVRDGKFEFSITGIERPGKRYGSGALSDEALGTWFVVHLTVRNIGDTPRIFHSDDQDLVWGSRKYTAESFTWSADNYLELNPGLKAEVSILFDVPEDFPEEGFGTVLELHDSFLSGGVDIRL